MSNIEQTDKIDFIGINKSSGNVVMTISDHLDWNNTEHHLTMLQEKINSYLSFYESGEIYDSYPEASGRNAEIEVIGKYPLSNEGIEFYERAGQIIEETGLKLKFRKFKADRKLKIMYK